MRKTLPWVLFISLVLTATAVAQPALPQAEGVDAGRLRAHCRRLLAALEALQAPLPAADERDLKALLAAPGGEDPDLAERVQKVLDPHCLIGVSINPESRVKAVRGPASAVLCQEQARVVLVKVCNDAGVTGSLAVAGPQLRTKDQDEAGRWLEAEVINRPPLGEKLSGERLQYVLLRLTPHEAGKREATLKFDVGQGTQDLGFRGEVPVLFVVRPARP